VLDIAPLTPVCPRRIFQFPPTFGAEKMSTRLRTAKTDERQAYASDERQAYADKVLLTTDLEFHMLKVVMDRLPDRTSGQLRATLATTTKRRMPHTR